jgi:macrolide transport system ATP-binding/permease protein
MLLLRAANIVKYYGDRKVLAFDEFKIFAGDKYGVVGANGAGKSTLLDILAGEISVDEGSIEVYTKISYIKQQEGVTLKNIGDLKVASELDVCQGFHDNMSGGEIAKARFAQSYDPNVGLLLADEPTSNMDMKGASVVEKILSDFKGALLIVSHDRALLDALCTGIIQVSDGGIHIFKGNYTRYMEEKEEILRRQRAEYEKYIGERERLTERLHERRENIKGIRKTPKRMGNSEARLHRAAGTEIQEKLAKNAKALERRIERLEVKEKPHGAPKVQMAIDAWEMPGAKILISASDLDLCFGSRSIFHGASFEVPNGSKTALIGDNGSGKTSLARMILWGDDRIRVAPGVKVGYFSQDFSILEDGSTILENLMKDSVKPQWEVRTIPARLLFKGHDVHKKVEVLSGGEKVKVSIAKLMVSETNFLILDEPTNYLDSYSLEALEQVIRDYGGTVLLISHDRKFIENVADRILIIEDYKIITFPGTLKEYRQKEQGTPSEIDETIIRMRLAELAGKMGTCKDPEDKEKLDEEYRNLSKELSR